MKKCPRCDGRKNVYGETCMICAGSGTDNTVKLRAEIQREARASTADPNLYIRPAVSR